MRAPEGGLIYAVYALAENLHKTVHEVLQMPQHEFQGWMAYFEEKEKRMKRKWH